MIQEIYPSLFLVRSAPAKEKTPYTYFVRRAGGNILFATKDDIAPFVDELQRLGGVERIFLGDRHHALPQTAALAKRFGAELCASQIEAKALIASGIAVGRTLSYERTKFAADLEIIPTPGHTPGAFSYLWSNGGRKFLFIGDTLVPVEGTWQYWVPKSRRDQMLRTVQALAALEFHVILSNSFAATPTAWIEVDPTYRKKMFGELIQGLEK